MPTPLPLRLARLHARRPDLPSRPQGLWAAVVDLVDRARAGDQNAMAILAKVGERARGGAPQAKLTGTLVQRYAKENPIGADAPSKILPASALQVVGQGDAFVNAGRACLQCRFGREALVATLANGPLWTGPAVRETAASCFGSDASSSLFAIGVGGAATDLDELIRDARGVPAAQLIVLRLGHALGEARAIQAVRAGRPIRTWSPAAAWELGEVA